MLFSKLRRNLWILRERRKMKAAIKRAQKTGALKLNIGSGTVEIPGWINLDLPFFDLRNDKLWRSFFNGLQFDRIVMEHVLEHLTQQEVETALSLARKHMGPQSVIRIAVPDKNHPNPKYIEYVKPGGTGAGSHDHKSFWNLNDFEQLCVRLDLQVFPLEHYDSSGQLKMTELDEANGPIFRTARRANKNHPIEDYSSLIVDIRLK